MTATDGDRGPNPHLARQVRGGSLLLGTRAFAVGINLATQVLMIRYLTAADYGAFALVLSLTWLVRNFSTLGLHRVLPRLLPQYHERHDYPHLFGAIALQATTILVLGLALWVGILGAEIAGQPIFPDEPERSLALIMALIVPLEALDYFLFETIMAVFGRPKMIALRKHVAGPLIKLAIVVVVIGAGESVQLLAAGYVLASALGIALYLPLVARAFTELGFRPRLRDGIRVPWEALALGLPLLTTDLMLSARWSLDAVVLSSSHGVTAVAELRAVQPAANLNTLVVTNFALLFLPLASRLLARRAEGELDEVYWNTAAWQTALAFPLFVATFSLAPITTFILAGEQYASSAPILAVLSLGLFISAALGPSDMVLTAANRVRYIVAGNVVIFAVNMLLLLALIPPFGAMGAAVATSLALVAHRGYEHYGLRGSGVRLSHPASLSLYATTGLAALGLLALNVLVQPHPVILIALAAVIVLLTLRVNRRVLAVQHAFPELLRLPWARQILGVPAEPSTGEPEDDEARR